MLKTIYRLFRMRSKLTNLVNNSGSDDYKNASQVMKASLTKIVNEDLKKYLVNIDIKTYLIWGINDQQVPYEDALVFEKLIPNSQLYTFYQSGHFPYITEKDKFIRLLNKILLSGEINGTNQNIIETLTIFVTSFLIVKEMIRSTQILQQELYNPRVL